MKFKNYLLVTLLAFSIPMALAEEGLATNQIESTCPAPKEVAPRFPVDALRAHKNGEVLLESSFDECGRALDVLVKKSSGRKDIDEAAMVAARQSIFSEAQRSKAINGKLERKFKFTENKNAHYRQVDWPKTHKKPRYALDVQPIPFESVAAAKNLIKDSEPNAFRPPVIDLRHTFIQVDAPQGREFWLFLFGKSGEPAVAARYRPVMEADEAIVKFAMKCELETKICNDIQLLLMRGLPFAKANK